MVLIYHIDYYFFFFVALEARFVCNILSSEIYLFSDTTVKQKKMESPTLPLRFHAKKSTDLKTMGEF